MSKIFQAKKIKEVYEGGGRIMDYTREGKEVNDIEDILICYDLLSGSYIKYAEDNHDHKHRYCKALAKVLNPYKANSLLEIGVGEATTLGILLSYLEKQPSDILGFDISWSRLKYAREFLHQQGIDPKLVKLFTGNLFEIPLRDNSIDVVYTSHSIEPNGGREEEALKECYRVAKRYLVLLEPAYDLATVEGKERMKKNGYVTHLYSTAVNLGYKVNSYTLFEEIGNPLNPTGLMIIEKEPENESSPEWVCPISKSALTSYQDNFLFCQESLLAYPILDGIPCLIKENAILASHLLESIHE